MPLSTAAKNTALDALPNTVYVAFFEGGAPGTGTEVVPATLWGSGNRPAVTLAAAGSGVRSPSGDASLGTVAVASQAVTHVAYYDAATSGALLGHAAYARTFVTGDAVSIPDANSVFSLTDPA
jgi:hypothetical protein